MSAPRPLPIAGLSRATRVALARAIEPGWRTRARCAGRPPEDWFPDPTDVDAVAVACVCCGLCPVRRSCLATALAAGEVHGIWGGATGADRRGMVQALARGVPVAEVCDTRCDRAHLRAREAA